MKDKEGYTPLRLAFKNRKIAAVRLLLEKEDQTAVGLLKFNGFDIARPNFDEGRALHWASLQSYDGVARLLLDAGVDIMARGYGDTALHTAVKIGDEAITKLLLEHGADVTARDNGEEIALHRAV